MKLSHFQAMLVFAFVISLAFAFLTKRKLRERVRYALRAFLAFLVAGVAIGWLMYPFSR